MLACEHVPSPSPPFSLVRSSPQDLTSVPTSALAPRGRWGAYGTQDARPEGQQLFQRLEPRRLARDHVFHPARAACLGEVRLGAELHDERPAGHERGLLLRHDALLL